jgi:hypothetical protein
MLLPIKVGHRYIKLTERIGDQSYYRPAKQMVEEAMRIWAFTEDRRCTG